MAANWKRKLEDFDPNRSDSEDLDYGVEESSPPATTTTTKRSSRAKSTKSRKKGAASRPPKKRAKKERYGDSEDDIEEDTEEESDEELDHLLGGRHVSLFHVLYSGFAVAEAGRKGKLRPNIHSRALAAPL